MLKDDLANLDIPGCCEMTIRFISKNSGGFPFSEIIKLYETSESHVLIIDTLGRPIIVNKDNIVSICFTN